MNDLKKAKSIGEWLLGGFCLGVGVIIGWIAAKFTWTAILVGFFSFIGFVVLAVLTYATVTDEGEETHTYPTPEGWDKRYEN
jgi:hypothetical protein